ncbi:MAG: hypothetical protein RR330_03400 [Alistipes sp.]
MKKIGLIFFGFLLLQICTWSGCSMQLQAQSFIVDPSSEANGEHLSSLSMADHAQDFICERTYNSSLSLPQSVRVLAPLSPVSSSIVGERIIPLHCKCGGVRAGGGWLAPVRELYTHSIHFNISPTDHICRLHRLII